MACNSTYKSGSNVVKNLNTGALGFKQLGQTKLTTLERDLKSMSWISSFSNWGLFEVLYAMLY